MTDIEVLKWNNSALLLCRLPLYKGRHVFGNHSVLRIDLECSGDFGILFFTAKVGKTSLIMSLVSEEFPDEVLIKLTHEVKGT